MPAMGKGILLSGLSLGFCGVSLSRWTKAHDLLCQQKIQKFQIAQGGKRVQRNAQVSCLLWKMLLPDWNGFAHKERLEGELKRS